MSVFLTSKLPHCGYSKFRNYFTKSTKLKGSFIKKRLNHGNSSIKPEISSEANNLHEKNNKFVPFTEMVNVRRDEAKKSILVQVQSSKSFKELHSYCSSIGTVKQMFHYKTGVEPSLNHFILVEFATESDVVNVLSESSHVENSHAVPIHSQFLWFKASNRKLKQSKNQVLTVEDGDNRLENEELKKLLQECENVSEQMKLLYSRTKLNDLGIRLRFITARQIELALSGMFPHACALPFGSSVNGYGKMGCDMDIVLRLSEEKVNSESRLIFHCKANAVSERLTIQNNIEVLGELIKLFMPGCARVNPIRQARVPIIKYKQQLTDVECDLSMMNTSGYHMSDFLYIMAALDERVQPLVFTIKKWASEVRLTSQTPGNWITNFSITLLVLAFLQKPLISPSILPTLNLLISKAEPQDKYITEEGINCTFLRDINKLNQQTKNNNNLEQLLAEFFQFYSQFDFSTKTICLNDQKTVRKPDNSALYIVNPLERGLNVSKNVSFAQLERFQMAAQTAAWTLESQDNNKTDNWGLLSLFDTKQNNINHLQLTKKDRIVDVSTLFEEEEQNQSKVEFKNDDIKRQVNNIKKETQNKIKEILKVNR